MTSLITGSWYKGKTSVCARLLHDDLHHPIAITDKQVFPSLEFIGWYTVASTVASRHIALHEQVIYPHRLFAMCTDHFFCSLQGTARPRFYLFSSAQLIHPHPISRDKPFLSRRTNPRSKLETNGPGLYSSKCRTRWKLVRLNVSRWTGPPGVVADARAVSISKIPRITIIYFIDLQWNHTYRHKEPQ